LKAFLVELGKKGDVMHKQTRTIFLTLLCLVLANGGCSSEKPTDLTVQPIDSPVSRPTTTVPVQQLSPWPSVAVDRGLLHGEPCNPPCWEGITPGISSEEDVVRTFDRLKLEERIEDYSLWNFRAEGKFGETYVTFQGEHVAEIRIHSNFDYQVRQAIERFGEPVAYAPRSNLARDDCSCENWDTGVYFAAPSASGYLLYPSQGVTILVAIANGYTGCICPEMKTAVFYYYQPRSLTNALEEDRSPACARINFSSEDIVQWHGYGSGY
jgi:hypothetical protein